MEDDEEDTEWEVTTPKKKTKRGTTSRNKLNNLSADVAAKTVDTNEEHGEESRANDESEARSAQAVCTSKQRDETVPFGMASMLAKLRDGMGL
jgi:hypothetical protein